MLIYRIENAGGGGPYTDHLFSDRWKLGSAHRDKNHLPPSEDPEIRLINQWEICGLSSPAFLRKWFSAMWLKKLHDAGFLVAVYESDEAREGLNGQVVFPYQADRVTTYPIPDFVAECKQLTPRKRAW